MSQDADEKDNDNDDDDSNTNEYPDNPPGISLEPSAARSEISIVPPENPVELPGVAPPENPVELPGVSPPGNELDDDFVLLLLPSDYYRNNYSDE